jgi:hypothetical protein
VDSVDGGRTSRYVERRSERSKVPAALAEIIERAFPRDLPRPLLLTTQDAYHPGNNSFPTVCPVLERSLSYS